MKYEAPDNRKCLRVTRLISEAQDQDDALTQIMKRYADINEDGQAADSDGAPQDAGDAPRKPAP